MPPVVAEKAMEIAEKAVDKQLEVMEQQQQKAAEFVDKKVKTVYRPALFLSAPPSLHGSRRRIDARNEVDYS